MFEGSGLSGGYNGQRGQCCLVVWLVTVVRAARWAKVSEWSGLPDGQKCLSGQGYQVVMYILVHINIPKNVMSC